MKTSDLLNSFLGSVVDLTGDVEDSDSDVSQAAPSRALNNGKGVPPMTEAQRYRLGLSNNSDAHRAIEYNRKRLDYMADKRRRHAAGDFVSRLGKNIPKRRLVPIDDEEPQSSRLAATSHDAHAAMKRTVDGLLKNSNGSTNRFTDYQLEARARDRAPAHSSLELRNGLHTSSERLAGLGAKRQSEGRQSFNALIEAAQLSAGASDDDDEEGDPAVQSFAGKAPAFSHRKIATHSQPHEEYSDDSVVGSGVEDEPNKDEPLSLDEENGHAGPSSFGRLLPNGAQPEANTFPLSKEPAEGASSASRTPVKDGSDSPGSFATARTSHDDQQPTPSLITKTANRAMKANELARERQFRPINAPQLRIQNGAQYIAPALQRRGPVNGAGAPAPAPIAHGLPRPHPNVIDLSGDALTRPSSSKVPARQNGAQQGTLTSSILAQKPAWANRQPSGLRQPFTNAELRKMIELRVFHGLSYKAIAEWYPGRSEGTIATTYNKQLEQNLERWLSPEEQAKYLPRVKERLKARGIKVKEEASGKPVTGTQYSPVDLTGPPKSRTAEVAALTLPAGHRTTAVAPQTDSPRPCGRPPKPQEPSPQTASPRPRGRPPRLRDQSPEFRPLANANVAVAPQNDRPTRSVARPQNYYVRLRRSREETAATDFLPSDVGRTPPVIQQAHSTKTGRRIRRTSKKAPEPHPKPYLSYQERLAVQQGLIDGEWDSKRLETWQGAPLHIDFDDDELEAVQYSVGAILGDAADDNGPLLQVLSTALRNANDVDINKIGWHAQQNECVPFRHKDDVEAFLSDLRDGCMNAIPMKQRLGKPVSCAIAAVATSSSNLRNRELGVNSIKANTNLRTNVFDSVGPSIAFTGTSGDVNAVAWSLNSDLFAAGSACLVDPNSMQYNRPNNLLFGSLQNEEVKELALHFKKREKQVTGVNASDEMYASQDPRLFMSVSAVDFSTNGELIYSAGYDGVVRYWDSGSSDVGLVGTIRHEAAVDLLAVHRDPHENVIATGCQISGAGSVRIVNCEESGPRTALLLASEQARTRPQNRIFPSALRWGTHPAVHSYLLAGFSANQHDNKLDTTGEVCLWDVSHQAQLQIWPNTRGVFDVAWSPNATNFAVACVAGVSVNRGVKSSVKLYFLSEVKGSAKASFAMDLECSASDVNDVIFSPYDPNLVTVGCTDGCVYMWDIRNYHTPLHTLKHRKPLHPLQYNDEDEREQLDTGVRFCSWGHDRTRLYSGSSDGVVVAWDPYRAAADAKVRDVVTLDSGIMSGAWSPDNDKLLIGSVSGRVDVLEVGNGGRSIRTARQFKMHNAPEPTSPRKSSTHDPDSGISAANTLLSSDAITLQPLGSLPIRQAVQGPNYSKTEYIDNAPDAATLRIQAAQFQEKMMAGESSNASGSSSTKGSTGLKITEEERGDSGRSQDRIPGVLSEAKAAEDGELLTGKSRCSNCRRPARPRLGDATPLCERCGFTCFRCGASAIIIASDLSARVECRECGGVWRVGVLGYEALEVPAAGATQQHDSNDKGKENKAWRRFRRWSKKVTDDDQARKMVAIEEGLEEEFLEPLIAQMHSLWSVEPTL